MFSGFSLFCESTVAQLLNNYKTVAAKKIIAKAKEDAHSMFMDRAGVFFSRNGKHLLVRLVNFVVYQAIKRFPNKIENFRDDDISVTLHQNGLHALISNIINVWDNLCSDYTISNANNNALMSKFNSPDYDTEKLRNDVNVWHDSLREKKRGSAATDGETILTFDDGFHWVILPRGSCDKEGKAMGHCGNSGADSNDRIFSLRDKGNKAYLTFIVNRRFLGESKAFGNSKPTANMHKYIVGLLEAKKDGVPYIVSIKGGGYKPENNFKLSDLSPEQQKQLTESNPYLVNPIRYFSQLIKTDEWAAKQILEDYFANRTFPFEKITNDSIVFSLQEYPNWIYSMFVNGVKNYGSDVASAIEKFRDKAKEDPSRVDEYKKELMASANQLFDNDTIEALLNKISEIEHESRPKMGFYSPKSLEVDQWLKGTDLQDLSEVLRNMIKFLATSVVSKHTRAICDLIAGTNQYGFKLDFHNSFFHSASILIKNFEKLDGSKTDLYIKDITPQIESKVWRMLKKVFRVTLKNTKFNRGGGPAGNKKEPDPF